MGPLRNTKASARVIECVAQMLSLAFVVEVSAKDMLLIRSVSFENMNCISTNLFDYIFKGISRSETCSKFGLRFDIALLAALAKRKADFWSFK